MSTVIVSRTKKEVDCEIRDMERVSKKISRTKKSAREFLLKHGFITKEGLVAKRYR